MWWKTTALDPKHAIFVSTSLSIFGLQKLALTILYWTDSGPLAYSQRKLRSPVCVFRESWMHEEEGRERMQRTPGLLIFWFKVYFMWGEGSETGKPAATGRRNFSKSLSDCTLQTYCSLNPNYSPTFIMEHFAGFVPPLQIFYAYLNKGRHFGELFQFQAGFALLSGTRGIFWNLQPPPTPHRTLPKNMCIQSIVGKILTYKNFRDCSVLWTEEYIKEGEGRKVWQTKGACGGDEARQSGLSIDHESKSVYFFPWF